MFTVHAQLGFQKGEIKGKYLSRHNETQSDMDNASTSARQNRGKVRRSVSYFRLYRYVTLTGSKISDSDSDTQLFNRTCMQNLCTAVSDG